MADLPPWLHRHRKRVSLTAQALSKVVQVASLEGVTFDVALDALVRLADPELVRQQLDADAGSVASWRLHGDDGA